MQDTPIPPAAGQESVWNYPRPPMLEPSSKHIEVIFNSNKIVDSRSVLRVLETSHPPVYYIPPADVQMQFLVPSRKRTGCEWKGTAVYYHVQVGERRVENAVWSYPAPRAGYENLAGYLAFYPQSMDACYVDGERVTPQPGFFYGGWITADIAGPFKGEAGSETW